MIVGMHRHLDPLLLMPKEGYNIPVLNLPDSINFYTMERKTKFSPCYLTPSMIPVFNQVGDFKEAILKAFHLDLFQ